jgi:hypothetical protein
MRHSCQGVKGDSDKEILRGKRGGADKPGESANRRSRCGSHFEALLSVDTTLTSSRLATTGIGPSPRARLAKALKGQRMRGGTVERR